MDTTLLKTLIALAPAGMLLWGSLIGFVRVRHAYSILQLLGAACAAVVVLTHVFEVLNLLPWMHWGEEHSIGHYVDLSCAGLALTLFPIGYLLQALKTAHTSGSDQ